MSYLNEIKSYLRDINLEILMENPDVKIDISKRYYNRFRLFYPSRKLIKYVTNIGGVLTGSRSIRCYTINGRPILERRVNDWDFIVTLDMAFKICDDMGIEEIPKIGGVISVKNQRRWVHPSYQDSYRVGPVDVQLIIAEELPDYTEIDGVRITNFGYSISQKIGLTSELQSKLTAHNRTQSSSRYYDSIDEQYYKHIDDLKEIIIKYNSIKCKL
jgi:hypothetical protein